MQIQPSYWSQIKSRSRQIGERLARQFEQLAGKPFGWMDTPHGLVRAAPPGSPPAQAAQPADDTSTPRDDDERFILGLVITYYRRNPQRAKTRLLELLSEVLVSPQWSGAAEPSADEPGSAAWPTAPAAAPAPGTDLDFAKTLQGITPLKRKR